MGLRVRAATAAAVATAGIADPASAALSASGGEPADPTRSLIAAVARGTTVALSRHPRRPRGSSASRTGPCSARRPGWPWWPAAANGCRSARRRPATAAAPGSAPLTVRLRDTGYRLVVSLSARRLELRRRLRASCSARASPSARQRTRRPPAASASPTSSPGRRFGSVYGCCILAISADPGEAAGELAGRQPDRAARHELARQPRPAGLDRLRPRRRAAAAPADAQRPPRDAGDHSGLNRYPTPRTVCSAPAWSPSLRRSPEIATSTTFEPPVHS